MLFSAGVLAHMASDGAEAWTIEEPSRDQVLARMVRAINRLGYNMYRRVAFGENSLKDWLR